ncbi:MAG: TonB-dependent receptor, partial [Terriglobales bacterium]
MVRSRFLVVLFLGSFFASFLSATGPTGTITGTVTDPSGAIVQKAHVTVRNEETNALRETQTNGDGDYTIALLSPGHYQVTVEMQGFQKAVTSGVTLNVDQTVRVDFPLVIGVPTQEIQITATPPIIQTDTSTMGQVITGRDSRELPLNERNFLNFTLLVPGAQTPAEGSENSTEGGAVSVNGGREQSNNFLLDGADNNDPYLNQYAALPSVEAIQEFKVQSSNYSAEFGRNSGAQVNVVLKGGTNSFHGDVFEFLRNRNMDAKNYFDFPGCTADSVAGECGGIPPYDRDQFGGTIGGPIRKDKTFFFVAYEGLQQRQSITQEATVPTAAQWQQGEALAGELFGCPYNPSCQTGQNVFNIYPQSNVGGTSGATNTYVSAPLLRNAVNLVTAKVDELPDAADTVSIHYSFFNQNQFAPFDPVNAFTNLPGYGSDTDARGQNAAVSWTRVFGSNTVNEGRFGYTRYRAGFFQENSGTNGNAELGYPDVLTNPVDLGFPNIAVGGFAGIGDPIQYPENRVDTTLQLSDNVAWTHGQNQFKIGGEVRYTRIDDYIDYVARGDFNYLGDTAYGILQAFGQCPGPTCPSTSTLALAQLLAGVPDAAVAVSGNTNNSLRNWGMAAYIQDDIHVVPRFLLNVGLRYEYNGAPVEAQNEFSVPILTPASATCTPQPDCQYQQAGTNGVPRGVYQASLLNFMPRIGIAWRPLKSERWVVRSAYGIFYDSPISQISIFPRLNAPYYTLSLYQQNPATCPGGLCTVQDILTQPAAPVQANTISPNFRAGYVQQWNLDLQYEVQPNWMVDVAYVGSKGTHLSDVRDINQQSPVTGLYPYQADGFYSSILYAESEANSSYNALQVRSEKRMSHGISFLAAYTWSKSIDDSSAVFAGNSGSGLPQNSMDLSAERGLSDFNAAQRLVVSFVWDVPLNRFAANGSAFRKALLDDWQASGILTEQTGNPFTVTLGGGSSTAALAFGDPARPNLVGNPFQGGPEGGQTNCPAQVGTQLNWINPCAFAYPGTGAGGLPLFGTEGRNTLTGPGFNNLDFSLSKSFALRSDRRHLQMRADIFNVFNHPNFDLPNHVLCSAGEASNTQG